MNVWMNHIAIVPILLPLLSASLMLFLEERHRRAKVSISLITVACVIAAALFLFAHSTQDSLVYSLGNWAAPFGIVLVADSLSSIMLVLTGILGLCTLLFSFARWDRAGPRFHGLFMLLLMGLNGAFLTGDLFNLFVFFEVLLAASYGLALHGSGNARVRTSVHYIAINLVASSLFLIGVSLIYGVSGTLNMAHIAQRAAEIVDVDKGLFNAGVAILGIAFLIKAGMWPLGFWLPGTYSAASAPVAAIFAVMSKVGIYALLRTSFLLSDGNAGLSVFFSNSLFVGGIATIFYGSILALSSRTMSRIACACVFISSGTILCGVSIGTPAVLSASMYYMINSTPAIAAFFLLIELINRLRGTNAALVPQPVFTDEYHDPFEDGRIDESQSIVLIPAALALLSGGFLVCAVLLAGIPPLSGFIGKFALMMGAIREKGIGSYTAWIFVIALTFSSLAAVIAIIRSGIEALWVPKDDLSPQIAFSEFISVGGLLITCILLTIFSGAIMDYMDVTVEWLLNKAAYSDTVLKASSALPRHAGVHP